TAAETMPDGMVYLAGGSLCDAAGSLTDEVTFEKFNPANHTVVAGPPLPVAKSNAQGYNVLGKFVVPGGAFTTPLTDVNVYDPATNTWTTVPPLQQALRNYAKGYGTQGAIHIIGGVN